MPIERLVDILADLLNLYELVEEIRRWIAIFRWSGDASLDLYLHFLWAVVWGYPALWLTNFLMRGLWRFLGARRQLSPTLIAEGEDRIWKLAWLSGLLGAWLSHLWWDGIPLF